MRPITSACFERCPCEKFNRATSSPARMSRTSISGDSEAGPMVATILVLCAGSVVVMRRTLSAQSRANRLLPASGARPLLSPRARDMGADHTFVLLTSVGCKICGISCWVPHHRLICDDHCCSRLDLIRELLSKLGVKMNSRSQLLRLDRAAFAGHTHPSTGFASGCELTR